MTPAPPPPAAGPGPLPAHPAEAAAARPDVSRGGGWPEAAVDAANRGASFLPVTGPGTAPAVEVAGVMAFLYLDAAGVIRLALDLDTAQEWLILPDGTVPVCVTVQGTEVYSARQGSTGGSPPGDPHGTSTADRESTARWAASAEDDARLLAWLTAPDFEIG